VAGGENGRIEPTADSQQPIVESRQLGPPAREPKTHPQKSRMGHPVHALSIGATLVSSDAAFKRVPGLKVEDWAKA